MELTVEPNVMRNPMSCVSVSANTEPRAETTRSESFWRPWQNSSVTGAEARITNDSLMQTYSSSHQSQHYAGKIPAFQHPVKLFWPKSQCYDFLYQEAEVLLRNFPVQATISFYQESDSDSESDSEEDEISDETQTT